MEMKTQFGDMVTGDFGENTMTFEIDGEMILRAGKYAIVPIDDYIQTNKIEKAIEVLRDLIKKFQAEARVWEKQGDSTNEDKCIRDSIECIEVISFLEKAKEKNIHT